MMQTAATIAQTRSRIAFWRSQGERIALVPTMGNLHAGHMQLVERARAVAARVVVSIFVNPLQFGANEDFARYPRTFEQDCQQLAERGVDMVFAPEVAEIYPRGFDAATKVTVPGLSEILCGAHRPGHFTGVATIVNKLFNIVQPEVALFGEKDFQQLAVIRRMAADLAMPVEVIGVPTVREESGLALSSRNGYLSAEERARAALIHATLRGAARRIADGAVDFAAVAAEGRTALAQAGFRPDYFEVRRAADLEPPQPDDHDLVILAAAWLGAARLIDNLRVARQ